MSTIKVGENENLESALRRFKRKCSRDGIIGDLRKKEFYEKEKESRSCKKEKQRLRNFRNESYGFFLRKKSKKGRRARGKDAENTCKRGKATHEKGVLESL